MATYFASAISLGDIFRDVERMLLGTRNFISGAVAIGTTKTKVNLAAAIDYCIDGIMYHKAITNDCFAHSNVTVQPVSTTKYYMLCINSSGTGSIVQGNDAKLPPIPAGVCPVGYLKIVTAAATFTPGTDDHDKALVTVTYVNLSCVPAAALA